MLFGDYVRQLLAHEGITPVDLAVHLDIDVSLVYRWQRHDRVPGANTNYVERIADYLNLDPVALDRLRAAQHASLGLTRQARLAQAAMDASAAVAQDGDQPPAVTATPVQRLAVSSAVLPRAITTRQHVFTTLLTILRQLPDPAPPHDRLILTVQGEDATAGDTALQQEWRQALQQALAQGWTIEQYFRLSDDPQRGARLARTLLALLGAHGRYRPYALPGHGLLGPPHDLFLGPPTIGAVLSLATEQGHHSDAAILIQHPGQVAQLRGYLRQLTAAARPLAQPFPTDSRAEYWRALTEIGERPGQRDQIKEGLSMLTRPPAWYTEGAAWWRRHGHTAASAALWRRRILAFERHLQPRRGGYRHRDLMPQDALETYVATGVHLSDLRADGQGIPDTPAERYEHLDRLFILLQSAHYQLALVRDLARISGVEVFWEAKANQGSLLQVYRGAGSATARRIDYLVDEPVIVNGLLAVFDELWQRLAFHERDQHTVRQLVQAKRDALRREARQRPSR